MNQVRYCQGCKELTPQRNQLNGSVCEVCSCENDNGTINTAFIVGDKWLANFWKRKYLIGLLKNGSDDDVAYHPNVTAELASKMYEAIDKDIMSS